MPTAKAQKENLVHVDDKGRVVLPREARRSGLYAVEVTDRDEIILRPRVAVDPHDVVSKKTLAVLDESMRNLNQGKAGKPINLASTFADDGGSHDQEIAARPKKRRR